MNDSFAPKAFRKSSVNSPDMSILGLFDLPSDDTITPKNVDKFSTTKSVGKKAFMHETLPSQYDFLYQASRSETRLLIGPARGSHTETLGEAKDGQGCDEARRPVQPRREHHGAVKIRHYSQKGTGEVMHRFSNFLLSSKNKPEC